MIGDIKPTTIYINGVPISGVKEINLEPAHPTGDDDMYKKQVVEWIHGADVRTRMGSLKKLAEDFNIPPISINFNVEPERKKVYLTTHNPYMSEDWKKKFFDKFRESYLDTNIANMYPVYYVPARHAGESSLKKLLNDIFDATQYILDEFHVPEEVWKKRECELDATWHYFNGLLKSAVKEESMNIVIYRSTSQRAVEASRFLRDKFQMSPFGQNVAMTSGGLCFSGITNALRIWIYYGDCEKMAGIHPDYFSSDSAEATEYLRQHAFGRGDTTSHGLYKLWTIISKYLNEQYAPKDEATYDWISHSPEEIMRDMKTILNRRKCAERYFEHDEWVWEISGDILTLLNHTDELQSYRNTGLPVKIYGICVRPEHWKWNHLRLVKKEKENAMNDLFATNKAILEVNGKKYAVRINTVDMEPDALTRVTCDVLDLHYYTKPRGYGYSPRCTFVDEMAFGGVDLNRSLPKIDQVIFNDPATIVYWKDGDKTVVQARDEAFDPEKGLAMAISKKAMGNTRDYYIPFKKWLKKFKKEHPDTVKLYADDQVVAEFPVSIEDVPLCDECQYGVKDAHFERCCDCSGLHPGCPNRFEPRNKEGK